MEYIIYNEIANEDFLFINQSIENQTYPNDFTFIGEGTFGKVYQYKDYAIKVFIDADEINDDPYILNDLKDNPSYPTVYYCKHDVFTVHHFIDGQKMSTYQNHQLDNNFKLQLKTALQFAFDNKYIPFDVHKDNIMIENDKLYIIDVGRFYPFSNVTEEQVEMYYNEIMNNIIHNLYEMNTLVEK